MSDAGNDESDFDSTSLFGSPPPSPTLGRSTTLALPGTSSAGNKNVGTIALPGSHNYSELPVSLPVLPAPVVPALSRARSQPRSSGSFIPAKRKKTRPARSKQTSEPPPHISLNMELGDEPPVGFLRNQQALLGIAGLVGRVIPSKLPKERRRGISPSDPIVVEDATSLPKPIGRNLNTRPLDPKKLPVPQIEAVITTLINQGNIFAVLKSLLVLLSQPNPQQAPSLTRNTQTGQPPSKRRRADVPAGADDWDVPYPFGAEEGPDNYHQTWHTQRKKQLILQLISIIKEAVEKASTKLHVEKMKKANTGTVQAQSRTMQQACALTQTRAAVQAQPAHHVTAPVPPPPTTTVPAPSVTPSTTLSTPLCATEESLSTNYPDPLVTPVSVTDVFTTPAFSDFETTLANSVSQSTSDNLQDDLAWLFSSANFAEQFSLPNNDELSDPTSSSSTRLSTPFGSGTSATATPLISQASNDIFNDPAWPGDLFDTMDSSLWDMTDFGAIPDIAQEPSEKLAINTSFPAVPFSLSTDTAEQQLDTLNTPVIPSSETLPHTNQSHPTCTNIIRDHSTTISSTISHTSSTIVNDPPVNNPPEHRPSSKSSQKIEPATPLPPHLPPQLRATQSNTNTLDRSSLLKAAKRRREQLAAEIARAKVELWETTMEQAVLVNLTKDPRL